MLKTLVVASVMAFGSAAVNSEVLQGIEWNETLGEVKARYPNAKYAKQLPGWLKPDQAAFMISGSGMVGELFVVFEDSRPLFKSMADETSDETQKARFKKLADTPDDHVLRVDWVRWIPSSAVPLSRAKMAYGSKPKCAVTATMSMTCEWSERALIALLSDDEQSVLHVTTQFTAAEKRARWRVMFGADTPIPSYLK